MLSVRIPCTDRMSVIHGVKFQRRGLGSAGDEAGQYIDNDDDDEDDRMTGNTRTGYSYVVHAEGRTGRGGRDKPSLTITCQVKGSRRTSIYYPAMETELSG